MIATERTTSSGPVRTRPAWVGWVTPAILIALPWAWFAIRDVGPTMNAIAFGLPVGAGVAALAAFGYAMLSERMRFGLVALSLAAFTVAVVVEPRIARPSPPPLQPFRLVASNTFDENRTPGRAVRALLAQHADVLVAVETRRAIVDGLAGGFPDDRVQDAGDLNVFSVWPLRAMPPPRGVPATAVMRVKVLRPGSPFVVYAIHLPNPLHEISFAAHAQTVARLLASAEREDAPVVLAGDFNMTDRSTSYRLLDGAMRDAMRASFAGSTYRRGPWALLQLRIDHVFVSPRLCSADPSTFPVPGSDHAGVRVLLGRCAA